MDHIQPSPTNSPLQSPRINLNSIEDQNDTSKREPEKTCSSEFPTAKLLIAGIFVSLGGGFNFGYQLSVINPMAVPLQHFLAQSLESRYDIHLSELSMRVFWSSVAGILFIGAVIGAAIMPMIVNKIGSRWSFVVFGITMITALLLSPISQYANMAELFILSRFIAGVCVGLGATLQGVFLTEISPVGCRGLMGTLTGLSTNIGVLVSSAVGLPQLCGTIDLWPYVYYVEIIPCLMCTLYAIFFLQESPLYFLQRKDEKSARNAVEYYYQKEINPDQMTRELQMQLREQNEMGNAGWMKLWTDRATRRAVYFSMLLNGTVSFSGIITMAFFGTFLLSAIGFTPEGAALANCLSSLSGTAGVLVGAITIDNIGRRFLLVGSMVSMILINIGMMVLVWIFLLHHFLWLGYCFLFLFLLFLFVFSTGIGPVAWFIGTELSDASSRAQVQSLSISAQYITCFLCPIIYSPLEKLVGPLSFLLFIVPLAFTASYIQLYMPETRNRSPEEIRRLLKVGKRQF